MDTKSGRLEKPDLRRSANGDVWELRGIEIGSYRGVPGAAYKEAFPDTPAMAFSFGFYSELKYFSCRIIRHGQGETEPNPPPSVLKAIRDL